MTAPCSSGGPCQTEPSAGRDHGHVQPAATPSNRRLAAIPSEAFGVEFKRPGTGATPGGTGTSPPPDRALELRVVELAAARRSL